MKRSPLVTLITALVILLAWPSYAAAPPTPDDVIEMADPARPPAGLSGPRPMGSRDISMVDYPRESFFAGEEGKVTIRVLVGVDGKVEDPQITTSSGSARLDDAAVQLVRQWRYVPAMRNGHPVPARFPVVINWNLELVPWQASVLGHRVE